MIPGFLSIFGHIFPFEQLYTMPWSIEALYTVLVAFYGYYSFVSGASMVENQEIRPQISRISRIDQKPAQIRQSSPIKKQRQGAY